MIKRAAGKAVTSAGKGLRRTLYYRRGGVGAVGPDPVQVGQL